MVATVAEAAGVEAPGPMTPENSGVDMQTTTAAETDELLKLYSERILALTTGLADCARLARADASAMKRSPLCGSTVTVDVVVRDGRIREFGQDVKACALGQASAAVLAQNAVGRSLAELETVRQTLHRMLRENGPPPTGRFRDLEALLPARDFRNRHASILLALDATLEAMRQATRTPTP